MNFKASGAREYSLVTVASCAVCLVALKTISTPFIVLAMPLTLIALYFSISRTIFAVTITFITSIIAINAELITPASKIHISDFKNISLMIVATLIFPILASYAMNNIRLQQKKIQHLSKRLNIATSSSGLGVWEWDTQNNEVYWNEQMFELYEIEDKTICLNRFLRMKFISREDKKKIIHALKKAQQGHDIQAIEFEVVTANGERKILQSTITQIYDAEQTVTKLVGVNSDVTKNYYTQRLLEQKSKIAKMAQEEFVMLFEMSPGPLLLTDAQGDIQKANGKAHSLFGYGNGELLSINIRQLFPNNKSNSFLDWIKNNSYSHPLPHTPLRHEHFCITRGGIPIEVELAQQVIHNKDGESIIISIRDMTEQKRVEMEISKAWKTAESANNAKSEFIANMSHEIRTPLNAILGTTKLLQNTTLEKPQLNYLNMIGDSGESLLGILSDILDISKIEAGHMDLSPINFNLENLLKQTKSILEVSAKNKNLEFQTDTNVDVGKSFYGDSLRIKQVLINLLSNAIKFTNEGYVHLSVKSESSDNGNTVLQFSIKDSGIGISEEKKTKLFSAFTQADNSITRRYGGTGLGLLISKRLVEMMGGTIQFESEPGRGSTFSFTIHLLRIEDTAHMEPILQIDLAPYFENMNILLVEDNKMNQTVAKGLLEQYGATVDIADNGEAAVEKLKNRPTFFEAILMDVQMPIMDGFTATKIIRDQLKNKTPIVAMSAGVMISEKKRCFDLGMEDFISKPINVEEMINKILKATGKSGLPQISGPPPNLTKTESVDFNPERLLKFVKGNSQRYESILTMIKLIVEDGFTPFSDAMRSYKKGDKELSRRQFHTLKSNMGNIGASNAWNTAQKIESAIGEGAPIVDIPLLFKQLQGNLEETFKQAKQWLDEHHKNHTNQEAKARLSPTDPNKNSSQFDSKLVDLCALLESNNMQALDTFEELKSDINKLLSSKECAKVEGAIQNFSFPDALNILSSVKKAF